MIRETLSELEAVENAMWDAKGELERFNKIPLTDREREMILAGNIKRLLNLK